jgi:broad specificity phosphatase PhoE
MPFFRSLAALILLVAPACATTMAAEQPTAAYFVVRHLHTPEGERDPDLTPEGHRHAALLADRLAGAGIAVIYVSTFRRTHQTAEPLARRLGLTPIVYDPSDTPALIARLRAETGPVLIVGHSNTVPDIVEQLGGERPAPLVHDDFGDLWLVRANGGATREKIGG